MTLGQKPEPLPDLPTFPKSRRDGYPETSANRNRYWKERAEKLVAVDSGNIQERKRELDKADYLAGIALTAMLSVWTVAAYNWPFIAGGISVAAVWLLILCRR